MKRHLASFSIGLLGVLVGAALVAPPGASGATGDTMTVGQANFADAATRIIARAQNGLVVDNNRNSGVAAAFKVQPGNPPFSVDSGAKVEGLNADRIDGRHADGLVRTSYEATVDLPETDGSVLLTSIDVPAAGYLIGFGSMEIYGTASDTLACGVAFGRAGGPAPDDIGAREIRHVVGGIEICSTEALYAVTPGTWQVHLWVSELDEASLTDGSVLALFVPFGSDGTPPSLP